MTEPGDFPSRPRERNPVFYGSFDWHSCVEMHWVLVRLLRVLPADVPVAEMRQALNEHFTQAGLEHEARFMGDPANNLGQRPYGWGWAVQIVPELPARGD